MDKKLRNQALNVGKNDISDNGGKSKFKTLPKWKKLLRIFDRLLEGKGSLFYVKYQISIFCRSFHEQQNFRESLKIEQKCKIFSDSGRH